MYGNQMMQMPQSAINAHQIPQNQAQLMNMMMQQN
jgi:hypothetical protein